MIFKTITDDVTGANKSIGLFGLSLQNIQNKLQEIQTVGFKNAIFNSSTIDKNAITTYNNEIAKGATAQEALTTASKGTNKATISLMQSAKGATISTEQLTVAQKASTTASKAQSLALKAVSIAGNMIAFTLIVKGVQMASDAIDKYVNKAKYAKEAMEEAQQAINEAQSTLQNVSSTISENKNRFLELSQGVDKFSKNLSLSEEDYAEYLSISNQLAEISPSLVYGYDEQGNALLAIGKNADETNEKLQSILETQKAVSQQTLIDNMDDVANGIYYEVDDANSSIERMKNELSSLQERYNQVNIDLSNTDGFINFNDDEYEKYGKAMEKALNSAGIKFSKDATAGLYSTSIQLESFSKQQLDTAQKFYDAWLNSENEYYHASENGLKKDIEEKQKSIETSYSKMTVNLQAWIKDNYNYQYLSDSSASMVDMLVPEIDWSKLENAPDSASDYQNYIEDNIIKPLMTIPQEHKQEIDDMFNELLSFKDGDITVLDFANQLQEKLDEYGITIDITPIIANEQEIKDKLQNSIETIAQGSDYYTGSGKKVDASEYSVLQEYTKDFNAEQIDLWNNSTIGANSATDAINRFEKALKSANDTTSSSDTTITFNSVFNAEDFKDTKEELLGLAEAGELTPNTLTSTKEYNELLKETGTTAKEATEQLYNMVDANTRLSAFSTNMGNVDKAYSEFKTNGFNTMDNLSSLESAFGDLNSYKKFIQVAGDAKSSTQEIQDAYNKLVTEYVYSIGILDTVNESNRGLIQTQLEHLGITNAEEIVTKALNGEILYLASAKSILTQYGYDLISVTSGELNALVKEGNISKETAEQIALFALKKKIANGVSITTDGDIANLAALAGVGSKVIEMMNSLATMKQKMVSGDGEAGTAGGSEYLQSKAKKLENDIRKELNKGTKINFNVDYSGGDTTSSALEKQTNKNKKTLTKFSQTIDWCAETITNLTNKIGNLNAKLNNTDALKNQIKYYKQLINAQNGLVKGYEKTADRYQKVYNKSLKKLSKADQNKVKNGAYTIEQFSGKAKSGKKSGAEKRYNNIQKAIEARDNVVSNSNNLIDAKAQLKEYAEGLASIRWDKASEKVDKLSNSISVLDTKLSNASGYKAKSAILKEQLDLQKQSVTAQENAVKNTQNDANGYLKKISSKYKKNKNKDGTIKTTGVTDKSQLKLITVYNAYVRKLAEETVELSQAQENYKAAVKDAAISNAEFVQESFDNRVSLIEAEQDKLNNDIELAETRGQVASANYYKSLTENSEKIKKKREEEKSLLEEQLATLKPYTDEWYTVKQAIFDVDTAIAEQSKNAVDNTNKQIKAMTELTSKMNSYISSATDALGWFDDLIESEDLYDDNGNLTNKAYASLKLKEGEVDGSKTRQSNYEKDLLELDRDYANGEMTEAQYLNAKLELEKNIRGEIKTQIDLRKEQNDIIKDSYKEQKKSLDEIIDKKKKALNLDKSEHDYRKSITEKTKNIADLQKQIAMLNGDTSEEAKAQRQKLEVELKDAQDDLDDTQWEKYIERYENAMDDLSDRLDVLIEKLDDLTSDGIKQVITTNDDKANKGIEEIAKENDIDTKVLGDTANNTLNGSSTFDKENEKAKKVYSSDTPTEQKQEQKQEDTTISNAGETIGRVILNGEIPDDIKKLLGDSDTSNSGVPLLSEDVVNKVNKFINNKDNTEKAKKKKSEYGILNKEIYDITNGRILSKANRLKLAKMLNITDANKDGDITGAEAKKVVELLKQIPGFSSGGIVEVAKRNGDDGLVTLKVGESVLTPVQTDALMQLGKNLVPLNNFMDIIQKPNLVPNFANGVNSSSTTTIDSINLNIPNVTDKESFIKMFKSEADVRRLFENSIDNRTIGGNRKLNANRL